MRLSSTFRPNAARMLELLGGTALYREPLVALREALQNAMDAVKERTALLRLAGRNPAEANFRIDFGLEYKAGANADEIWIFVQDNGAGMSRSLLLNYFLVSGEVRPDLDEREKRCRLLSYGRVRNIWTPLPCLLVVLHSPGKASGAFE